MRSLSIAATGMMAQQLNVEVISNNIANMTTTGYKRRRPEFQDLLYQNQRRIGASSSDAGTIVPAGVQIGLGVKTAAVYRIHEQGNMVATENRFDLAIQGSGYFVVELPNGEIAYTRAGNFQLSPEGQLVTADGYTVSPGITVPEDAIQVTINPNGLVQAKIAGQVDAGRAGPAGARDLRQRGRPGGDRQQPADGDAGVRSGGARHRPAAPATASCSRASSRARTSIRCRRSPR